MTPPATMEAWVIRPDRLGDPVQAMRLEQIEVPEPGPGEVRVRVMAAGVNYNGVWAAAGLPVSIFRYTGYDFHIAGSDASGIVDQVGPGVTRWEPGDEVVIHCNQSCGECAECNGRDPMACSSTAWCRPSSFCPSLRG
jgi:crotonyl-CoA carboxylase/reductase